MCNKGLTNDSTILQKHLILYDNTKTISTDDLYCTKTIYKIFKIIKK